MESLGLLHLYYGDGKGKTTAALGLMLRAAGAGMDIYFGQFMKTGDTSEALEALGLTAQEVVDDPRLNRGICKAHQVIMGRDE